jgi:hypothetical protein
MCDKKYGQNSKVHYLLAIHDFYLTFHSWKVDYDNFK